MILFSLRTAKSLCCEMILCNSEIAKILYFSHFVYRHGVGLILLVEEKRDNRSGSLYLSMPFSLKVFSLIIIYFDYCILFTPRSLL